MNLKILSVASISALVVGIVLLGFSQTSANAEVSLDISNDDFEINGNTLNKNIEISRWTNLLTVSLDSEPANGYKWQVSEFTGDKVIEISDNRYRAPENGEVFGKEIWTFNIVKSGTGIISMEYNPPQESSITNFRKLEMTIVAQ